MARFGFSEMFVGVIVIAIIGNAAEHYSAVIAAYRDQMTLAVEIAVGSSAQIALLVAPMVVLYSTPTDPTRNLAVFDGLDAITTNGSSSVNLSGFLVPNAGFDAKLGVIAYEGDDSLNGDSLPGGSFP